MSFIPDMQRLRNFDSAIGILRRIRNNVTDSDNFAVRGDLIEQLRPLADFIGKERLLDDSAEAPNLTVLPISRLLGPPPVAQVSRTDFLSILDQTEELLEIRRTIFSGEVRAGTEQQDAASARDR